MALTTTVVDRLFTERCVLELWTRAGMSLVPIIVPVRAASTLSKWRACPTACLGAREATLVLVARPTPKPPCMTCMLVLGLSYSSNGEVCCCSLYGQERRGPVG